MLELAIVIVVIALLAGGVLVARDLIAAATIRKTVGDYTSYETAYNAFKLKYNCLPGDCANMQQFMPGGCAWPSTGNMTCNGDGDRKIWTYESHFVCQHLGFAGLISGSCFGGLVMDSGVPQGVQPGANALPSSLSNFNLMWVSYTDDAGWPPYSATIKPPGNYISILSASGVGNYYPSSVVNNTDLYTNDARQIDEKLDDGKPFSGRLIQLNFYCGDDVSNTYTGVSTDTAYKYCHALYRLD